MRVLTAPDSLSWNPALFSVFLAGTIEQGRAPDWQAEVVQEFEPYQGVLLNPRRKVWDPSWPQDPDFPPFREQVEWELEGLERARLIAAHLVPGSQSSISLLEIGIHSHLNAPNHPYRNKLIVSCSKGFHKYGNIIITCRRYGIPVVENLGSLMQMIKVRMGHV